MAVYKQNQFGGGLAMAAYNSMPTITQKAIAEGRAKVFNGRPDPLQFDDGRGTWKGINDTSGYVNRAYNPTQNDNGYTRFDSSQYGAGLERAQNYAAAVPIAETYFALKKGQPGYDHAQDAKGILKKYHGITDWTKATDKQLFEAYDSTFRGLQKDNQKVQGGTLGKIAKLAAAAAATYFTAGAAAPLFGATTAGVVATGALAGAAGATTSGVLNNNLSLKGVGIGAGLGGIGGFASNKLSPFLSKATDSVRRSLGFGSAEAFTQSSGLGLSPSNLFNTDNFASLGGTGLSGGFTPSIAASNGLGLGLSDLFKNFGSGGGIENFPGGGFFNPDALKLPPDMFGDLGFESLGATPTSSVSDIIKEIAKQVGDLTTFSAGNAGNAGNASGQDRPRYSAGNQDSSGVGLDFSFPNLFGSTTDTGFNMPQMGRPIEQPGALSSKLLADKFGSPDGFQGSNFNLQARGQGLGGPQQQGLQRKQAIAALL